MYEKLIVGSACFVQQATDNNMTDKTVSIESFIFPFSKAPKDMQKKTREKRVSFFRLPDFSLLISAIEPI
jgi:hypothetical protein